MLAVEKSSLMATICLQFDKIILKVLHTKYNKTSIILRLVFYKLKLGRNNKRNLISIAVIDVANVGSGNLAPNDIHVKQALQQTNSTTITPQPNNQSIATSKKNNHHHNHTNVNTSLQHQSHSFIVKPSIFPFLNR